jgi:hypothetical protein
LWFYYLWYDIFLCSFNISLLLFNSVFVICFIQTIWSSIFYLFMSFSWYYLLHHLLLLFYHLSSDNFLLFDSFYFSFIIYQNNSAISIFLVFKMKINKILSIQESQTNMKFVFFIEANSYLIISSFSIIHKYKDEDCT